MCGCNKNKAATQPKQPAPPRHLPPLGATHVPLKVVTAAPVFPVVPVDPVVAATPSLPTTDASVWGPPLWKALHIAAQHTKYRAQMLTWKTVLDALRSALPCPECSAHYNEWYSSHQLRFSMFPVGFQNTVINWLAELHNGVNTRLGRPTLSLSQLNGIYGGNRAEKLAEGRRELGSLNGIIGKQAYNLLMSLLH